MGACSVDTYKNTISQNSDVEISHAKDRHWRVQQVQQKPCAKGLFVSPDRPYSLRWHQQHSSFKSQKGVPMTPKREAPAAMSPMSVALSPGFDFGGGEGSGLCVPFPLLCIAIRL